MGHRGRQGRGDHGEPARGGGGNRSFDSSSDLAASRSSSKTSTRKPSIIAKNGAHPPASPYFAVASMPFASSNASAASAWKRDGRLATSTMRPPDLGSRGMT